MQPPPKRSFFLFGPRGTGKTGWPRERLPRALAFDPLLAHVVGQLEALPWRGPAAQARKLHIAP